MNKCLCRLWFFFLAPILDFTLYTYSRYCDSKIGVGIEAGLCPAFCTSLHRACREDFFHYPLHGDFGPCAVDRQSSVVCAKMVEFAASGSQLCSMLGLLAHDAATCFDGTPSTLPSCAQTPLPRRGKRVIFELLRRLPIALTLVATSLCYIFTADSCVALLSPESVYRSSQGQE